ncbi:hypothetical protein [Sorangium sp. So ce1078]|uniref:hypothetical protein n=1 Tax=Sorangium sp. So ce1078 TaxID=3133329 RepID=UPI003F617C7E
MREALASYVNRVRDLAEHVKGNEQATKQSLIGPLFTLLGYDLTDPRQCLPEYRVDFGKDRSVKPIDWAFLQNARPIFFVEAKEAGRKLAGFDEQLADYFAKAPDAKLGVLTNGIQWRFRRGGRRCSAGCWPAARSRASGCLCRTTGWSPLLPRFRSPSPSSAGPA